MAARPERVFLCVCFSRKDVGCDSAIMETVVYLGCRCSELRRLMSSMYVNSKHDFNILLDQLTVFLQLVEMYIVGKINSDQFT
jgi:hypothetical protein